MLLQTLARAYLSKREEFAAAVGNLCEVLALNALELDLQRLARSGDAFAGYMVQCHAAFRALIGSSSGAFELPTYWSDVLQHWNEFSRGVDGW